MKMGEPRLLGSINTASASDTSNVIVYPRIYQLRVSFESNILKFSVTLSKVS